MMGPKKSKAPPSKENGAYGVANGDVTIVQ
jgi:hypothetical protein